MIAVKAPSPKRARRRALSCRHLLSCFLGALMPRGLRRKGGQGPGRHRAGPATLLSRAEEQGRGARPPLPSAEHRAGASVPPCRLIGWRHGWPSEEGPATWGGLGPPVFPSPLQASQRWLRGMLPLNSLALPATSILGTTCRAPLLWDGRPRRRRVRPSARTRHGPGVLTLPAAAALVASSPPLFWGDEIGSRK